MDEDLLESRSTRLARRLAAATPMMVALDDLQLFDLGFARPDPPPGECETVVRVRPAPSGPAKFEVVAGAARVRRRQISSGTHKVQVVALTSLSDSEAYVVAMREHLAHAGEWDLAVARSLENALRFHFRHDYVAMAKQLAIPLKRFRALIDLARLPEEIIACFPLVSTPDEDEVTQLARRLRNARRRNAIIDRARLLAADQHERGLAGRPQRSSKDILLELCDQSLSPRFLRTTTAFESREGQVIARVDLGTTSIATVTVKLAADVDAAEMRRALDAVVELLTVAHVRRTSRLEM